MKKIISMIIIFVLVINLKLVSFADDGDEENLNENEIAGIIETTATAEDVPKINSRAVLIFDRTSKRVIYEKNGYSKRAMASTTKILTAVVVLENANLTDTVEISAKAGRTRRLKARFKEK